MKRLIGLMNVALSSSGSVFLQHSNDSVARSSNDGASPTFADATRRSAACQPPRQSECIDCELADESLFAENAVADFVLVQPRDASVLMSLDGGSPTSPKRALPGGNIQPTRVPSRPSRDMRRPSEGRQGSVASIYPDESPMVASDAPPVPTIPATHLNTPSAAGAAGSSSDSDLIAWVNAHLPPTCPERATDISTSFRTGKLVTRVIEHVQGSKLSSERSSDDVFELQAGEPNIEGLFAMFDKCIDENVDHGGASPNDIRTGNVEQTRKLLENLRQWGQGR